MSVDLMKAVYARLTAVTDGGTNPVRTSVSDRIYALEAPARSAFPLIIYTMDPPDVDHFFGGKSRQTATFTVTIFGKVESGPDAMVDIEKQVADLLDQQSLSVDNHDRGFVRVLSRGTPETDGEVFRVDTSFEIVATSTS